MKGKGSLGGPAVGAVAIVDAPVSQWYARRAQVTTVVVGLLVDAFATAVLSVFCPLLLAVALGALAGIVLGFAAGVLVRVWPVLRVLLWWWVEVFGAVVVVGGPVTLAHTVGRGAALAALAVMAGVCGLVGRARRLLFAWSNVVIVRHRLRLCFARIIRGTGTLRPGSLPLILWGRPTPAGERVWLWLRPGLSLEYLQKEDRLAGIAVACIARQARVVPASERYAALLRVDITRRDPLRDEVASPLALLIPALRHQQHEQNGAVPVSPGLPPVGLDLADIQEPAAPPQQRGGGRR
jgi:hypothetical protein